MANEERLAQVNVLTDDTYQDRKIKGELRDDTIYFVREAGAHGSHYMSLYVGATRQTDVVCLNNMGFDSNPQIDDVTFTTAKLNETDARVDNKIFYYENRDTKNAEPYVYSKVLQRFIPMTSLIMWEEI